MFCVGVSIFLESLFVFSKYTRKTPIERYIFVELVRANNLAQLPRLLLPPHILKQLLFVRV